MVLVLKFISDTNEGNRLQFWPARTISNRGILGCVHVFDLVLLSGSKLNERYWLQLLFHFIVFISLVATFIGMSCFRCFRFYCDTFSYCTSTKTFALGFQKWLDNDWVFSGVFGRLYLVLSTRFLHGVNFSWIARLFIFFDDIKFCSTVSSVVFLVCSVKMFIFFNHRFL